MNSVIPSAKGLYALPVMSAVVLLLALSSCSDDREAGRAQADNRQRAVSAPKGDAVRKADSRKSRDPFARLQRLASGGDADAANALGELYLAGKGVKRDYHKARRWFEKAAEQRHVKAQYNLGLIYREGLGVDRDLEDAVAWYKLAAAQGLAAAQRDLGIMYFRGLGLVRDIGEAIRWTRKAADQGDNKALFNLGTVYHKGTGVRKNLKLAIRLFSVAAKQGYQEARDLLETELMNAARSGNSARLRMLLHGIRKVDLVTKLDFDGVVFLAVKKGVLENVRLLGEHGVRVNREHLEEKTMLMHAVARGYRDIAAYLLQKGARVDAQDRYGYSALMHATDPRIVRLLIEHKADLNLQDKYGRTALMHAVRKGRFEIVRLLVQKGADIDAQRSSNTPLAVALASKRYKIASFLIAGGANVNATMKPGFQGSLSVLEKAVRLGRLELVRALLDKGAKVGHRVVDGSGDWAGYNALLFAAYRGHLDIVRLLVERGADLNAANGSGQTALMIAASLGHTAVVDYLLKRKADVSVRDKRGRTALDYSSRSEIKKMLLGGSARPL